MVNTVAIFISVVKMFNTIPTMITMKMLYLEIH